MTKADEVMQLASQLPVAERVSLARRLILSLDDEAVDSEIEASLIEEVIARVEAVERGEAELLDLDDVLADIERRLDAKRTA